jgi:hypothetical protein
MLRTERAGPSVRTGGARAWASFIAPPARWTRARATPRKQVEHADQKIFFALPRRETSES